MEMRSVEKAKTCTFTGHRENKLPWRGDESDLGKHLQRTLGYIGEVAYRSSDKIQRSAEDGVFLVIFRSF